MKLHRLPPLISCLALLVSVWPRPLAGTPVSAPGAADAACCCPAGQCVMPSCHDGAADRSCAVGSCSAPSAAGQAGFSEAVAVAAAAPSFPIKLDACPAFTAPAFPPPGFEPPRRPPQNA